MGIHYYGSMCKIIPGPQQMIQVPSAEIEPRDVSLRWETSWHGASDHTMGNYPRL